MGKKCVLTTIVVKKPSQMRGTHWHQDNCVILVSMRPTPLALPQWRICLWSAGASAGQWSLRGPQSRDDYFNQSMHLFSEQAHSTEIETTGAGVPIIWRESKNRTP